MAADRRGVLIPLLIIAWIFLSPVRDPARDPHLLHDDRPSLEDAIAGEQRSLSLIQNSTFDPAFGTAEHKLNLTGLEEDRGFAWESLPAVKARAREQLGYSLGEWGQNALNGQAEGPNPTPLYKNVTGYVQGKWRRSKLQVSIPLPQLNLSAYAPLGPFGQPGTPRQFDRNITGNDGEVTIKFIEKDNVEYVGPGGSNVTEMGIEMRMTDAQYDKWDVQLRGVYFAELGQAILTTTSDKLSGIFMLPHLALSNDTFTSSRQVLNESISQVIQSQIDRDTESLSPWSSRSADGDSAFVSPECDVVVYLQQLAPVASTQYSSTFMSFLERELRFPTGAIIPNPPDLRFSLVAFSPDCGYVLESRGPPDDFIQDGNHLTGPKMEVQYRHSRQHLLVFTFALALQLFLLMRQIREASTPSTRSRISFYTIAMLAFGDGFATMTFLLLSLFLSGLWVNLVGTGFLAFVSVSFFGMRFLMDIWHVQAPERERVARAEVEEERRREEALNAALQRIRAERQARLRNTATNNASAPTTTEPHTTSQTGQTPPPGPPSPAMPPPANAQAPPGALPFPITARRPIDTGATPLFMPSDQEGLEPVGPPAPANMDAAVQARMPSFASLYTRFYLLLLLTLFLSLNATSWPGPLQRVFFTLLAVIYFSFWIPQIHRNVQRNCRHALNWEFVLGQSVLRLAPFGYFYGYRHNVLFAEVDYYGLALLAVWVWIQVIFLVSQELIGPRWFIKKDWAPPAYDYHPVLREDEEGATMPIGFSQATADASSQSAPTSPIQERTPSSPLARRASTAKESKEKGKRIFDCAICMQDLEVPVVEAGAPNDAGLASGLLARRTYMVTPCRHIFHSACLEGWMKYRLQCPICRETLPPL